MRVVAEDVAWAEVPLRTQGRRALPVARGLALALPLLALFGALLVTADQVFGELLRSLVPDVGDPTPHLLAFAGFGWLAGGALWGLLRRPAEGPEPARAGVRSWAGGEIVVALALLDVLFGAFVAVQLGTFFGGDALVQREVGLTYSEYARQGFFQLVAATALAVPLLLAADWAVRGRPPRVVAASRALSVVLVCLLLVVVASALQRLRLYQRELGLTEARVFATAAVLWLAGVLAWLAATVLAARRERFVAGALATAFAALLALNAVNPDGLIARVNVDRAADGRSVDVDYLTGLSDDATPALVRGLRRLARADAAVVAGALLDRERRGDWRTWNVSRAQARDAVREHAAQLEALAGPR